MTTPYIITKIRVDKGRKAMFKAWVLVCALNSPTSCVTFEDEWGPYPTTRECKARVEQMIGVIVPTMPTVVEVKFRCEALKSV